MSWIESHDTLARHPKTQRLVRLLGVGKPAAIGHLHLLWWWSLEYAEQGDLRTFDDQDLADAALWEGDAAAFVQALTSAGFLDGDRQIHDWQDYAGRLLEQRAKAAERQRNYRNGHKGTPPSPNTPDPLSNGHVTSRDISPNSDVTVMSPSRNVLTVPNDRTNDQTVPESTIPPTPQPEPLPLVDAAAHAARADGSAPQGKKPRRAAQEVPKPSAGWDFPLLWQLVTDQQGYKPTWDYGRETKAVKHLLTACPGAQPADFARFLAYVGTCWPFCEEPTRQPTFSEGAKHFGAWYTGGQPERSPAPEKQRSRYESPSERTAREWRESIGSIESLGFNQDRDYQEPPALPDGPAGSRVIDLDGRRVGGNVGRDPDGLAGARVPGGAAWATG